MDSFSISSNLIQQPRDFISIIEVNLAKAINSELPEHITQDKTHTPLMVGADVRRSRTFPIVPSVELVKDEYSNSWLLSITTTDCPGILYHLASLFNKHHVSLHMAKVMTLGERAEDVFMIESQHLSNEKNQLAFERDILETLNRLTKLK